MIPPKAKA
jgi:hypothetical protein